MDEARPYGVLAEFPDAKSLLAATRGARDAGFAPLEAYAPHPVAGLRAATGARRTRLSLMAFAGGVLGGAGGLSLQYWVSVIAYPINVGGRPLNSWPAFLPVIFETTVLGAALTAAIGMLALSRLPRLHHPAFYVPAFTRASSDAYFLCVRTTPDGDAAEAEAFLQDLQPLSLTRVSN